MPDVAAHRADRVGGGRLAAGIRNIWEYDDQVFDFADGRLVLRGPNGSGKSNAAGAARARSSSTASWLRAGWTAWAAADR